MSTAAHTFYLHVIQFIQFIQKPLLIQFVCNSFHTTCKLTMQLNIFPRQWSLQRFLAVIKSTRPAVTARNAHFLSCLAQRHLGSMAPFRHCIPKDQHSIMKNEASAWLAISVLGATGSTLSTYSVRMMSRLHHHQQHEAVWIWTHASVANRNFTTKSLPCAACVVKVDYISWCIYWDRDRTIRPLPCHDWLDGTSACYHEMLCCSLVCQIRKRHVHPSQLRVIIQLT